MSFSSIPTLFAILIAGINLSVGSQVYDTEISRSVEGTELSFVIVGDWGQDNDPQYEVASAMGKWCDDHKCEFVLSLGDNFYGNGVFSNDSERFQKTWSDVYNDDSISTLDWYVIVGNHDHGNSQKKEDGHEWFQVEHSQLDPRWIFPDLAYSLTVDMDDFKIKFVNIDTESIRHDVNDPEEMLSFMDDQLNDNNADWKIVSGHHPCYSATGSVYSHNDIIREKVRPIMQKYETDIYFCGHEHNQQHYQVAGKPNEIDYIVTGAGGKRISPYDEESYQKSLEDGGDLLKLEMDYGFVHMTINAEAISWKMINRDLEVVYENERIKM